MGSRREFLAGLGAGAVALALPSATKAWGCHKRRAACGRTYPRPCVLSGQPTSWFCQQSYLGTSGNSYIYACYRTYQNGTVFYCGDVLTNVSTPTQYNGTLPVACTNGPPCIDTSGAWDSRSPAGITDRSIIPSSYDRTHGLPAVEQGRAWDFNGVIGSNVTLIGYQADLGRFTHNGSPRPVWYFTIDFLINGRFHPLRFARQAAVDPGHDTLTWLSGDPDGYWHTFTVNGGNNDVYHVILHDPLAP